MQEITVIVMVDTKAAIESNSIADHIYLIDNLRTEGSIGEGTADLTSKVNATHWIDGSQSGEYLFNWLPYAIASMSPTLPRGYVKTQSKLHDKSNLKALQDIVSTTTKQQGQKLTALKSTVAENVRVKNHLGEVTEHSHKLMDLKGDFIVSANQKDPINAITHQTPQITDITGEAVDKGIIFPAQYGTPVQIKDGWYWSASTNGAAVGSYSYTMHITLFNPIITKEGTIWEPVYFTHDAKIEVTTQPVVNGFTNEGCTYLPIIL